MDAQKLKQAGAGGFDSPQFATWYKYLTEYNKMNPKKEISAVQVFSMRYNEEDFLKLLATADDGPGAMKFKDEVVKGWLANPDHPANMFKRLKLHEAGDDLLANPVLSIWTRYMKAFNKEYPFAATTTIQTLTKSYGEEKLATMIQAATKVEETKQFAKNLQTAQLKQWMSKAKTPDDIYKKVLKLDSTDSPNADIWRAYYNAYDKEHPGKLFSFNP
ncbi:hypothetical protein PF005_g31192 [Phytophthora fragariae]|uniref:RxLR effector protein n=2 Tax=Phytophthora fragariae TaxID=53985 RepID=A0A6A3Q3T3_9STRA|nr:hypothetical protein PF006_g31037 [Phytophthora fragariae]KAE9068222.1 hypothetical protein PF007_g27769 [Phytophthora fragariae]KAE9161573.1 hypothetical protein PF005_g31192 [Phytophthora fragariae]KAE9264467.1 hypothetical protein PF001_g31265 [Phytophthora fragariae]